MVEWLQQWPREELWTSSTCTFLQPLTQSTMHPSLWSEFVGLTHVHEELAGLWHPVAQWPDGDQWQVIFFLKDLFQDQYCQTGSGYPISGTIQGQVGWSYKKLDPVKDVLLITGHWIRWFLKVPSSSNYSMILILLLYFIALFRDLNLNLPDSVIFSYFLKLFSWHLGFKFLIFKALL